MDDRQVFIESLMTWCFGRMSIVWLTTSISYLRSRHADGRSRNVFIVSICNGLADKSEFSDRVFHQSWANAPLASSLATKNPLAFWTSGRVVLGVGALTNRLAIREVEEPPTIIPF